MPSEFALVLVLALVAAAFVFVALFAGKLLRPANFTEVKGEIYECGEPKIGPAWINFNIRFYFIALIFVIFDVEAAFMFPVASVYQGWVASGRSMLALVEILLFVLILFVGLVYAWAKGDLKWIKGRV